MTSFQLRAARRALRHGEVIAYPTEAVWGLGCDPLNARAVTQLLNLKQRPMGKGLILITDCFEGIAPYLQPLTAEIRTRVSPTWPGPVTWVLPVADWVPDWLTGGRDSLAVRVTAHPVAAALCGVFGGPLVSTSANPSGRNAARGPRAVRSYFGTSIYCVPGATGGQSRPTQIRDALTGAELRSA